MREPTLEQAVVLANESRVRLVRSAPGSGKTWLVAELIRQELGNWPSKTSGIAALSFTRVAGDEIRKALGYEPGQPHFVGTIDAFLFRYVVRPFLTKCFPGFAAPRLIPGEWGAESWGSYGRGFGATVGAGIHLFGCVFTDEKNGKPVLARKPHPAQPLRPLAVQEVPQVMCGKRQMWERSGCVTHSDAAFLASEVLEHKSHGGTIRAELVRRFPLIVVDELQDTGFFLGKSIRLLLNESKARGVLVGDPDQAIFEFSGARPDMFNGFESVAGATTLPLSTSRRCGPSVAAAASHLKDSGGRIDPAPNNIGRAYLVRYVDMVADMRRIADTISLARTRACIKLIARQNSAVEEITGRDAKKRAARLGCPPLNHMQRSVLAFRQGRPVAALAAARAALDLAVLQHEGVDDAELQSQDIDPSLWRRLAVDCLLSAVTVPATGSLGDWQTEVGRIVEQKVSCFALAPSLRPFPGKLKPTKVAAAGNPCADYLPESDPDPAVQATMVVGTVHSVKGETHDVTIFVCRDAKANRCPSAVWWSGDEKDREEKRIAYVAMTRTRGDLIMCVSGDCYQRLCASRKAFVESFECMTVDECTASLAGLPALPTTVSR